MGEQPMHLDPLTTNLKWLPFKNYARYQQMVSQNNRSISMSNIFVTFSEFLRQYKSIFQGSFIFKFDNIAALLLASQCSLTSNFQMAVI